MWPRHQPREEARPHAFDLYEEGQRIGTLRWRARPRRAVGWYLARTGGREERIFVDGAIEELARDDRSAAHDWELHAELAAILSTALALDAAARALFPERARGVRRFRRSVPSGRYVIHVADLDTGFLARVVPELHVDAVSDVTVLAGDLLEGGLEAAVQRIALVGGRIVGVFPRDEPG